MSITSAIRRMMAAGLTWDQALIAAEAFEAEQPRAKSGAERQRAYRARRNEVTSPRHSDESDTPSSPLNPLPQTPTQTTPLYPPAVDDDAGATLADGDRLRDRVEAEAVPDGHPLRVDVMGGSVCRGWIRSGYDPDRDVLPGVARALEGRWRITRWEGLSGWVANAHADRLAAEQARPPPIIAEPAAVTIHQPRPRNVRQNQPSALEIAAALASDDPARISRVIGGS